MKGIKAGVEAVVRNRGGVAWLEFPAFAALGGFLHAISTRQGGVSAKPFGDLNFSFRVGDHAERVAENRRLFAGAVGVDATKMVTVNQVHGDGIVCVAAGDEGKGAQDDPVCDGDALITNLPGLPLFIQTADCLPVLLMDPVRKVVGVAHAGWKSTFLGIAAKTAAKMVEHYGCQIGDLHAAFGPSIGPCCFEVDATLRDQLKEKYVWGGDAFRSGFHDKWHLDLEEVNARQLVEVGVPAAHLIRPGICTIENLDLFYSHRAEAGVTGRFASVVMLK